MADNTQRELGKGAEKAYDRMLSRVEKRLADAENRTWETLQAEIEEAVEFEEELKEFTRDELRLMASYLKRDLSHLVSFVGRTGQGVREWLRLDLARIENRLQELLFSIADQTRVETLELQQKLEEHAAEHYIEGELATAGVLRCLNCSRKVALSGTSRVQACEGCGSHYFERLTAHTPDVDPEAG